MTTKTSQISHNILGFFGFIGRWVDQRQQNRAEEEKAKKARWEQELAERKHTEELLFLKLLQSMARVCENLKPMPWVTYYNGWNPGPAVRALTDINNPTSPIYEIHLEDPHRDNRLSNYCNIEVYQYTPEFEHIYSKNNLFVSDKNLRYLKAVFDLTARRNMSSTESAQTLQELKHIEIKKSRYWDGYPEAHAIKYLEGLLPQNQSK